MRIAPRFFFALLVACVSTAAFAQDCNLADPRKVVEILQSYDDTLASFSNRDCLGDPKQDKAEVVKDFDQLLGKEEQGKPRLADPVAVLKMLSRHAADRQLGLRGTDWT